MEITNWNKPKELNLIKYSRKQKEQEENIRKNKNKKGEEQR